MTTDGRQQLTEALDAAERVALEASRDGDDRTTTGEHWRWECSNCDTPLPITDVVVLDEFLECPACGSSGVGLRSVEQYQTSSVGQLPHLVTHGCEEMRPVDALHMTRWDPSTVLRLVERDRKLIEARDEAKAEALAGPPSFVAASRHQALMEQMHAAAAFWLGTQEADRG